MGKNVTIFQYQVAYWSSVAYVDAIPTNWHIFHRLIRPVMKIYWLHVYFSITLTFVSIPELSVNGFYPSELTHTQASSC